MKKVLSTIVAALVALSFSAVVFAADMPAGHPATDAAAPAVEKKEAPKKAKKAKKTKKAKKEVKKEETAPAAPAAK